MQRMFHSVSLTIAKRRASRIWDRAMDEARESSDRIVAGLPHEAIKDVQVRDMFRDNHVMHALADRLWQHGNSDNTLLAAVLHKRMQVWINAESQAMAPSTSISPELANNLMSHTWVLWHVKQFLGYDEVFTIEGSLFRSPRHADYYFIHVPSVWYPTLNHAFSHVRDLKAKRSKRKPCAAVESTSKEKTVVIFRHTRAQPGRAQTYNAGSICLSDAAICEYQSMLHSGSPTALSFGTAV